MTHNIRRFYGLDNGYPFDWWVSPAAAVAAVLRRPDTDWIYDPDLLELADNGTTVRHCELGMLFHHEFPRAHGHHGPIVPNFRDSIDSPKSRTRFLLDRLLARDQPGQRLLFLRSPSLDDPDIGGTELDLALADVFRAADWAYCHLPAVGEGPPHGWQGDPVIWDSVLDRLNVVSRSEPGSDY
jgi:hypothetical protein